MNKRTQLMEEIRSFQFSHVKDATMHQTEITVPNLSQFQLLFNNNKHSDFFFRFKKSGNIIYAHKVILSTCDAFNAMLSIQMREQQDQFCEIDDEDDDEVLFTAMIKFLYGFPLIIPHDQVFSILLLADKYGYEELFKSVKQWLIKSLSTEQDAMVVIKLWELPQTEKFKSIIDAAARKLSIILYSAQVASYMLSHDVETFERFLNECCTLLDLSFRGNMINAWIDQDESTRQEDGLRLYRSLFQKNWPTVVIPQAPPVPPVRNITNHNPNPQRSRTTFTTPLVPQTTLMEQLLPRILK
jgi:hypothetical protein